MPFPTREITARQDIADIYQDNVQNILQKTNVSNMIGLLQQLNTVSKFASEIFTDILQATDQNKQRIYNCRQRLKNIEQRCPSTETLFINNAPSYFYDNPYTDKEWQRRDPLRGLLFRRDLCTPAINRRRAQAQPAPHELNALNSISMDGACLKKFTDSNFFMNEWLEAEKLKMKEAKRKRKAKKKKKKKKSRHTESTVLSVQKTRYDPITGEKIVIDGKQVDKTIYHLTDDRGDIKQDPGNQNQSQIPQQNQIPQPLDDSKMQDQKRVRNGGVQKSTVAQMARQQKVSKAKEKKRKKAEQKAKKVLEAAEEKAYAKALAEHEKQKKFGSNRSAAMSAAARKAIRESAKQYLAEDPAVIAAIVPVQVQYKEETVVVSPPPVPVSAMSAKIPPPIPGNFAVKKASDNAGQPIPPPFKIPAKVNDESAKVPPPIPSILKNKAEAGNGMVPPPIPVVAKKKLSAYEMSQQSMQQALANAPKQVKVAKPKAGQKSAMLLSGIRSGVKLLRAEPVKKYVPKDARSMLMASLKKKAAGGLKKVTDEMKSKPARVDPAANAGSIFEILNRRRFMADDSSDEDSDDSWGTESD